MTLDEAIEHVEEVATTRCGECAEEHEQLADWLRELRRARMEIDLLKTLRNGFKADAQKYKAENAKLRELVGDLYSLLLNAYDPKEVDDYYDRMHELGIEVE